jgi:hypothetical protein
MAGTAFLLGMTALVVRNVAARVGMKARRFNDRPGPTHIGSCIQPFPWRRLLETAADGLWSGGGNAFSNGGRTEGRRSMPRPPPTAVVRSGSAAPPPRSASSMPRRPDAPFSSCRRQVWKERRQNRLASRGAGCDRRR